MNAKPQSHAKMVDSARTHMKAINAYANLDLREKIAKQVGLSTIGGWKAYRWLQVLSIFAQI